MITFGPPPVWAVPGPRELCLLTLQPKGIVGITCDQSRHVQGHGIALTLLNQGKGAAFEMTRLVVGLVPDGSKRLILHAGKLTRDYVSHGGIVRAEDGVNVPPRAISVR